MTDDTTLVYFSEFVNRSKLRKEICLGVCVVDSKLHVKLVGPDNMTPIDVVRLYNDYLENTLRFHGKSNFEALKPHLETIERRKDLQGILTEALSEVISEDTEPEEEATEEENIQDLLALEPSLLTSPQLQQVLMNSPSTSVYLVQVQIEDCRASIFFGSQPDTIRNLGLLTLGFRLWLSQMKDSSFADDVEDDD